MTTPLQKWQPISILRIVYIVSSLLSLTVFIIYTDGGEQRTSEMTGDKTTGIHFFATYFIPEPLGPIPNKSVVMNVFATKNHKPNYLKADRISVWKTFLIDGLFPPTRNIYRIKDLTTINS